MRYYIRENKKAPVQGPFSVHELATKILENKVQARFLASSDLGESVASLHNWRRCDWFPLSQIPALSFPKREKKTPSVSVEKPNQRLISSITSISAVVGLITGGSITHGPLKYLITALSILILLDLLRRLSPIQKILNRRKTMRSEIQKETTQPCN